MLVPGAGEQPSAVYPGLLGTIKEGDLAGMAGQLLCPENMETKEIGLELQLRQKC